MEGENNMDNGQEQNEGVTPAAPAEENNEGGNEEGGSEESAE